MGRIYREVAAVLPIPSSVESIKDLINEVPHDLEYTDHLMVYMWPRSLFGGGYAQFDINARLTPSEFSQLLAELYGVGPEHFFGLSDVIQRIKQSVGATNSNFGAPLQIHSDSHTSSRAAHLLHSCPQKTNCGE